MDKLSEIHGDGIKYYTYFWLGDEKINLKEIFMKDGKNLQ